MGAVSDVDASVNLSPGSRLRSDGPLTAGEISWCRANDIVLAYCPIQYGLVPVDCIDDMQVSQSSHARSAQSPRFASGRLVFRRWGASDAETFANLLGNERVWRYLPDPFPGEIDRRAAEDLIALSNEAEHHDVYAVEDEAAVVGQARLLFDVNSLSRDAAEISYWLGDRYWGQGRGTAIVASFVRESFSRWPELRTIVARVHKDNQGSARVLIKSGFRPDRATLTDLWQLYYCARPSGN